MRQPQVKILFVEDEPTDADLAVFALEGAGAMVDHRRVETRTDLVRELKEFQPDVLVLDLDLPGFDGISALAIAREESPDTPAIMFTGSLDAESVSACVRGGAQDFVPKTHLARFPSAVGTALERRSEAEERCRREGLARRNENRFRSLAETALDAIIVADDEGRIQFGNLSAAMAFGYLPDQFYGLPVENLFHGFRPGDTRLAELAVARPGVHGRKGFLLELEGVRLDGSRFPAEISFSFSEEGGSPLLFAIVRDVSDRKAFEEALERLIRQHEVILDSVMDGILVVDERRRIQFANRAALRITGFKKESLLGGDVGRILVCVESDSADEGRWASPALAPQQTMAAKEGEADFRRAGGAEFRARFSSSPLMGPNRDGGIVLVFQDITEKTDLEAQLRQAQKMEAVGLLTGGIAHDFNNLLSVILLHAEAMEGEIGRERPAVASGLKDIRDAGMKAAEMTAKLLGFSRRAPLRLVPVDVGKTLTQLQSMLRRVLPENIRLKVEVEEGTHTSRADSGALEQIFLNLATNARDAMASGGRLDFHLTTVELDPQFVGEKPWARLGRFVRVRVRDTGHGMDEGVLAKAFDPFFTTKGVGEGTGLGLAMVYGLVRQHSGLVHIESEVGKGTEVQLFIPALDDVPEEVRPETPSPEQQPHGERILVVEDDPRLRSVARSLLSKAGYRVLEAQDGEEAITLISEVSPDGIDLVISDLVMPRMGGMDLWKKARAAGVQVPFLFTSGYPDQEGGGRPEESDDVHFLPKPWRRPTLFKAIRKALRGETRVSVRTGDHV